MVESVAWRTGTPVRLVRTTRTQSLSTEGWGRRRDIIRFSQGCFLNSFCFLGNERERREKEKEMRGRVKSAGLASKVWHDLRYFLVFLFSFCSYFLLLYFIALHAKEESVCKRLHRALHAMEGGEENLHAIQYTRQLNLGPTGPARADYGPNILRR